jgi:hypothetical protein
MVVCRDNWQSSLWRSYLILWKSSTAQEVTSKNNALLTLWVGWSLQRSSYSVSIAKYLCSQRRSVLKIT